MPRTTTVHLLTGDYADRLEVIGQAALAARDDKTPRTLLDEDPYAPLKDEYDALKAEAIEAGVTVHLAGVGRSVWRSLKEKYPARSGEGVDPETAKEDKATGLNGDAVEDDLVYLSIKAWEKESGETDPRVSSRAAFDEWADSLSEGEWQQIVIRAWELANGARLDPKRAAVLADEERRLELRVAHFWRLTPEAFRALPDGEQDEMTFYVVEVCRECGNLKSVCSDPTVPWYPQRSYCYASAAREQEWRQTRKVFKHPEPTDDAPHVTDGLSWWVSLHDLTPEDDFYGAQSLVGLGPVPAADSEADHQ